MTDPIRYDIQDGNIAVITLDRADTRNAQDTHFLYALNDAFDKAAEDDAIRCIILRAEGPHFSSGHDLRERGVAEAMAEHNRVGTWTQFDAVGEEGQMAREMEIYVGFCERWRNLPKPTIAAVQGKAIAGGLMLVWPMDIVIAADDALFMDNTVAMGVGGHEFFTHPFELGVRKAKEMLFTADFVTAEEALRLGMANHVVPRDELDNKALAVARKIAEKPLFALRLAKEAVNNAQDAQGRQQSIKHAFALHHLAHAHNQIVHGGLIDPTLIKGSFGKKAKAKDAAE